MPEHPNPKVRQHPWKGPHHAATPGPPRLPATTFAPSPTPYAELQVTSNFTFLTGASHPEELVQRAAELGYRAIGISDRMSFAGIVRAHVAAKAAGIPLAIGTRIEIPIDQATRLSLLVYPTDLASYGRLSLLLTRGKLRTTKGECELTLDDLLEFEEGVLAIMLPTLNDDVLASEYSERTHQLAEVFDEDRFSLAASLLYGPDDQAWLQRLKELSARTGVPLLATNDVHYHVRRRRFLQGVVTCIRAGCTLEEAGFRLFSNSERHLKTPEEMHRLFIDAPRAIDRAVAIAKRASAFSLDELSYQYPSEADEAGRRSVPPMKRLIELTWAGAHDRYPDGIPPDVRTRIGEEFQLIRELRYAPYFLTVHDLVGFARSRGILCQGRGAAANSAVCYCLGVTAVDPDQIDMLFERFISKERDEPPDIDIDFEHERREEVIQYIYAKYGRNRAALTAEVITYRGRSAIRDVGKAMGLSLDCVDRLAKDIDWWHNGIEVSDQLRKHGLDPNDPATLRTLALTNELIGFPRHLSQHVGGFVITAGRLSELVPIENAAMPDRTVIEWDKDDIDALGILKVDVLGLGMLTCVRKTFRLIEEHGVVDEFGALTPTTIDIYSIPPEDPAVYDMICDADTVGVFQIESRAQMAMLPRLRPRNFYDLVIDVAIVRPGPIHGDMVHPYLRRRNGEEPVTYPSEAVKKVLGRTLGIPLFQEQAMALSMVAAGFTPGEADQLRRAMAAWKRKGDEMQRFGEKLRAGMLRHGYSEAFAARFFKQIEGFSEYGFPESHAASFAHIVYVSAWLKKYHPAAFAAGLLNSQPMGFYAPAQIVQDAQAHGVEVRPLDVNHSHWDCTLETSREGPALRLGLRVAKGLRKNEIERFVAVRERDGAYESIESLKRRGRVSVGCLRKLAAADAFRSLGLRSEEALWEILALRDSPPSLFDREPPAEESVELPSRSLFERVMQDYSSHRLSLKAHPVAFIRKWLNQREVTPAAALKDEGRFPHRSRASTAGLVLCRQRPATAKGIFFMTLEDETGVSNLVVHPEVFERHREAARHGTLILARGRIERAGQVVHLRAERLDTIRLSNDDFAPASVE